MNQPKFDVRGENLGEEETYSDSLLTPRDLNELYKSLELTRLTSQRFHLKTTFFQLIINAILKQGGNKLSSDDVTKMIEMQIRKDLGKDIYNEIMRILPDKNASGYAEFVRNHPEV